MIVGSGLMARAFQPAFAFADGVMVHAAGVSNSGCSDVREFDRERLRLAASLEVAKKFDVFIYFGTCSVEDPEANETPYVRHKLAMETMVRAHSGHIILRVPQVAGVTPNPHTLLNYLFARISRGERFAIWSRARRNIIDVDDVASIGVSLVRTHKARGETINVANTRDFALGEIVQTFERVTGKRAIFDVINRGRAYRVNVERIRPLCESAGVCFDDTYLERVLRKYYG